MLLLYSLLEHQSVVDNIKIHPTPSLLYLHMTCHLSLSPFQWIFKTTFLYIKLSMPYKQ